MDWRMHISLLVNSAKRWLCCDCASCVRKCLRQPYVTESQRMKQKFIQRNYSVTIRKLRMAMRYITEEEVG